MAGAEEDGHWLGSVCLFAPIRDFLSLFLHVTMEGWGGGKGNGKENTYGMTGKSSGAGKWTRPKVCQRTMSVFAMGAAGSAAIQAGRSVLEGLGSPEVWGLLRVRGVGSVVLGRCVG